MPPRFVYWTILIDQQPTAFRAKDREDLLPTLGQLRRTNKDVVMKWFARGRLWESPEAERAAQQKPVLTEKRGRDWRPGGLHKDPRARFDKRGRAPRPLPGRRPGADGERAAPPAPPRSAGEPRRELPRGPRREARRPADSKPAFKTESKFRSKPPASFGAKPARARPARPFRSGPPRPRRDRRK